MKKTFFTFCSTLLFLSTFCFQSCDEEKPLVVTGNIEGTVINLETQENLSGANVVITSNSATTFTEQSKTTGSDGKFSFKDLEAGSYKLSFSKDGFDDNSKNINLIAGQTSSSDVSLKPIKSILKATPILLDFGQNTNILPIEIRNTGKGELNWTIAEDLLWLSVNPVSGKTTTEPTSVSITVDRDKLTENSKVGTFVINSNGGSVVINISVGKAGPVLSITPSTLDFGGVETEKSLNVQNIGVQTLTYEAKATQSWITLENPQGSTTTQIKNIKVIVNRAGMSPGDYSGSINVNSNSNSVSVPITMKVSQPSAPEVLNGQASGITSTAAQVSGNITAQGSSAVTQHGHCWSTSPNPTTANNKTTLGGTSVNKSFVSNLSGLSPNTSYYVKAYATNSVGTTYSDAIELTTLSPPTMATVKTLRIENVIYNAVDGIGELTKLGDGFITDYGFCYSSTNATPTLADSKLSLGSTTKLGEFTGTISGLRESTKYFVRAYATNSMGTAYGGTIEQTTKVAPPLLTAGLLAYYTFDNDNCNDYFGEENFHGIVQGTGTELGFSTDIPGVTGKSLKGSAGGKYYKLLKAPDYSSSTTTFMAWMKTKVNGDIYYRGYGSETRGIWIAENKIRYSSVYGNNYFFSTDVSTLFLDGNWHHISVVWSSSNVILYIDGRYIETATSRIGNYGAEVSYLGNFTGLMDNLRIYNRALTQDEVKQIFNAKQ